jgi:hypothetical protein
MTHPGRSQRSDVLCCNVTTEYCAILSHSLSYQFVRTFHVGFCSFLTSLWETPFELVCNFIIRLICCWSYVQWLCSLSTICYASGFYDPTFISL